MRGLNRTAVLLNRAAVGWAVSCSAFGLFLTAQPQAYAGLVLHGGFFFNRAAAGVRGSSFTRSLFLNRAAVGWAVSCSAFGIFGIFF